MSDKIEVLISKEEVENRIQEMADQITKDYAGKTAAYFSYVSLPRE